MAKNGPGSVRADFFAQASRNTEYLIHPEEIVADSLALFLLGKLRSRRLRYIDGLKEMFIAGK